MKYKLPCVAISLILLISLMSVNVFAMQIFAKIDSSRIITIEIEPTDTILDVKLRIQDKSGIAPEDYVLFYSQVRLEDENRLTDYHIQKDSTLKLELHSWDETYSANGTVHWYACSDCDEKKELAVHTVGAPATETTPQTCTVCGYVISAAPGHIHDGVFVPEIPASAENEGTEAHYKCRCGCLFADESCNDEVTEADLVIPKLAPTMLEGNNGSFTKGSTASLTFISSAALDDLISVSVDGAPLDSSQYTKSSGSTVITLYAEYLNTLSLGDHILTITSESGAVTASFTVVEAAAPEVPETTESGDIPSPQTSDGSHIPVVSMLCLSAVSLIVMTVFRRREEK